MSKTLRNTLFSLMGSAICAGFLSCGTAASNNDQGTSFLAFGWFSNALTDFVPIGGARASINSDAATIIDENGSALDGKDLIITMGIQNRLTNQFITVRRIDCSYDIEGSSIAVPNESQNSSVVLAPAENPEGGEPVSTSGLVGQGTEGFASSFKLPLNILTSDIFSFLNVYKTSLPELPFRITAICHAVGVTQAGDTITSNDLFFPIYVYDTAECCTGNANENPAGGGSGGFQGGIATGGGIDFSDGTNSADITANTGTATN